MSDTTDQITRIKLTAAELEFLVGQDPDWPAVREALNGVEPDSPQVVAAGAASLLARDLARPDGSELQILQPVLDYARRLVRAEHRIGITLLTADQGMAPAVYCVGAEDERTLVSIEAPGVIALQAQPADQPAADQALELVEKAIAVEDPTIAIKVPGQLPVIFRRQGEDWQLGDPAAEADDPDHFFQSSSEAAIMDIVRDFFATQFGSAAAEDGPETG